MRWHSACSCREYQAYVSMFCCTYLISLKSGSATGRCSCMSGQHKLHLTCTLVQPSSQPLQVMRCHAMLATAVPGRALMQSRTPGMWPMQARLGVLPFPAAKSYIQCFLFIPACLQEAAAI